MSLDRITLAAYAQEIEPRIKGRRIEKVRPHGKSALRIELSTRDALYLDVSRSLAGLWLLSRTGHVPDDPRDVEGPSRTSALLFKKHLEGARIDRLTSDASRTLTLVTSRATVILETSGAADAALMVDADVLAHFGAGERPSAGKQPGRSVLDGDAARFVLAIASAPRESQRQLLNTLDPGLLPILRRWPVSESAIQRLAAILRDGSLSAPFLSPAPADDATHTAAPPMLMAFEPDGASQAQPDFLMAGERLYVALRRADLFRDRLQSRMAKARAEVSRLSRLKAALERDRGRWPEPAELRRQAEALLAAPTDRAELPRGRDAVVIAIPDPRGEAATLSVRIHPSLSLPQNANALYAKARNIERQKGAFDARWEQTLAALAQAEGVLSSLQTIRSLEELETPAVEPGDGTPSGKRSHYLTARGLQMIFGRSAAENHDVTFKLAKREDIWFHVLDAP
ncbi:MAG: hypothetical protein ABI672_22090, partial [Vicinamibacteria bacterium]